MGIKAIWIPLNYTNEFEFYLFYFLSTGYSFVVVSKAFNILFRSLVNLFLYLEVLRVGYRVSNVVINSAGSATYSFIITIGFLTFWVFSRSSSSVSNERVTFAGLSNIFCFSSSSASSVTVTRFWELRVGLCDLFFLDFLFFFLGLIFSKGSSDSDDVGSISIWSEFEMSVSDKSSSVVLRRVSGLFATLDVLVAVGVSVVKVVFCEFVWDIIRLSKNFFIFLSRVVVVSSVFVSLV